MLVRITSLLRTIVFAPWFILRPLLPVGRGPSSSTPPTRAKARVQAQKRTAAQSSAPAQPQPQQTKAKKPKMGTADGTAQSASSEEKSKLAEQAKSKGELSYSYWAGKGGGDVPLPEPKKLTEEQKAELERQTSTSTSGASAWNAAGTFEERGATSWAKSRLKALICERELPGGDVSVLDVNSCEGEANIFIVRGKKRCGFDFELQLAWKAVPRPGALEIRGQCTVLNFSSDDPDDLELCPEISHRQEERADDEAAALSRVKAVLKPELSKVLSQLLEELKAK